MGGRKKRGREHKREKKKEKKDSTGNTNVKVCIHVVLRFHVAFL